MQLRLRGPAEVEKHISPENGQVARLSDAQADTCSIPTQCLDADAKFAYTGEHYIFTV